MSKLSIFGQLVAALQVILCFAFSWTFTIGIYHAKALGVIVAVSAWLAGLYVGTKELLVPFEPTPGKGSNRSRVKNHLVVLALWSAASGFCFDMHSIVGGSIAATQIGISLVMLVVVLAQERLMSSLGVSLDTGGAFTVARNLMASDGSSIKPSTATYTEVDNAERGNHDVGGRFSVAEDNVAYGVEEGRGLLS